MEIKKIIFGEKMPDKDDPEYKEKHEKCVNAGKSFARTLRLDKAAAKVQRFASTYPKLFLCIIFGFVLFSIGLNLYRMSNAVSYRSNPSSAVERQKQQLHFKRHHAPAKRDNKEIDNPINETDAYEDYRQD